MTISAADVLKLRGAVHTLTPRLDLFPLKPVATALVNQATFAYPLAQIAVDTTSAGWTNVKTGMLVRITDLAGSDVLWSTARKDATSNTLFVSAISLGDSGYAMDIAPALSDNYAVTVYQTRPLWGFLSRISGGLFYKRWDVAYTDEGSSPAPVCNIGAWQAGEVGEVFSLSASASFAWGSKTITGYAWSLPTGVTLQSGTLTSASITVTASAGEYVIACTVTDSGGKTHTAYLYLFAGSSFGQSYRWVITRDDTTREGREMRLTIYGNNLKEVLYPGAPILYTEKPLFDGQSVSAGVMVDKFCGYLADYNFSHDGDIPTAEITVKSPFLLLKDIPVATQAIFEVTSPANWTQVNSTLSNPAGAIWYLLQHHAPAVLQLHDFDRGGLTTQRKKSFTLQQRTLAGQLTDVIKLILGNVGSDDDGTTLLRKNPLYENNTFRNGVDQRFTWGASDLLPSLTYPRSYRLRVGQTVGYGFAYAGGALPTPYGAIAGKAQAQAVGSDEVNGLIVASQTELNEKTGHYHQASNAPTPEIGWTADRNLDIVRPARMEWHLLNVSSTYDPRGVGWTNQRLLPVRVSRDWQQQDGQYLKKVAVTMQPETFGQPAVVLPVDRGGAGNYVVNGAVVGAPNQFRPVENSNSLISLLLPFNSAGRLARTFDLLDSQPHYEDIGGVLLGAICDADWDWWCDFFAGGMTGSGALRMYVLTASASLLRIYRFDDLRKSLAVTLLGAYTMGDASVTTSARIRCSRTTQDFVAVHWCEQTKCRVGRSTDGGATWGSIVEVGTSFTANSANDNAECGFAIEGEKQLCTGNDGTNYKVYYASTKAGSFAALGSSPTGTQPFAVIEVDQQGSAYIATPTQVTSEFLQITFDDPSESYTITDDINSPDYSTCGLVDIGGAHGKVLRNVRNSTAYSSDSNARGRVTIPFVASAGDVIQISFDYLFHWASLPGSSMYMEFFVKTSDSNSNALDGFILNDFSSYNDVWKTATYNIYLNNNITEVIVELNMQVTISSSAWVIGDYSQVDNILIVRNPAISAALGEKVTTFDAGGYGNYVVSNVNMDSSDDTTATPWGVGAHGVRASATSVDPITLLITITFSPALTMNRLQVWAKKTIATGSPTIQVKYRLNTSGSFLSLTTFLASNIWRSLSKAIPGTSVSTLEIEITNLSAVTATGLNYYVDTIVINPVLAPSLVPGSLYRVDTYIATPSWTDITPAAGRVPKMAYGFAVDRVTKNRVIALGDNGINSQRYVSTDRGATWTPKETNGYKAVRASGDYLVLLGKEQTDFSIDGGVTLLTREGDLATIWGSLGTLRGGLALL